MRKKIRKKSIHEEIDRRKKRFNTIWTLTQHILVTQFKINEILPTDPSTIYKTCNNIFWWVKSVRWEHDTVTWGLTFLGQRTTWGVFGWENIISGTREKCCHSSLWFQLCTMYTFKPEKNYIFFNLFTDSVMCSLYIFDLLREIDCFRWFYNYNSE